MAPDFADLSLVPLRTSAARLPTPGLYEKNFLLLHIYCSLRRFYCFYLFNAVFLRFIVEKRTCGDFSGQLSLPEENSFVLHSSWTSLLSFESSCALPSETDNRCQKRISSFFRLIYLHGPEFLTENFWLPDNLTLSKSNLFVRACDGTSICIFLETRVNRDRQSLIYENGRLFSGNCSTQRSTNFSVKDRLLYEE